MFAYTKRPLSDPTDKTHPKQGNPLVRAEHAIVCPTLYSKPRGPVREDIETLLSKHDISIATLLSRLAPTYHGYTLTEQTMRLDQEALQNMNKLACTSSPTEGESAIRVSFCVSDSIKHYHVGYVGTIDISGERPGVETSCPICFMPLWSLGKISWYGCGHGCCVECSKQQGSRCMFNRCAQLPGWDPSQNELYGLAEEVESLRRAIIKYGGEFQNILRLLDDFLSKYKLLERAAASRFGMLNEVRGADQLPPPTDLSKLSTSRIEPQTDEGQAVQLSVEAIIGAYPPPPAHPSSTDGPKSRSGPTRRPYLLGSYFDPRGRRCPLINKVPIICRLYPYMPGSDRRVEHSANSIRSLPTKMEAVFVLLRMKDARHSGWSDRKLPLDFPMGSLYKIDSNDSAFENVPLPQCLTGSKPPPGDAYKYQRQTTYAFKCEAKQLRIHMDSKKTYSQSVRTSDRSVNDMPPSQGPHFFLSFLAQFDPFVDYLNPYDQDTTSTMKKLRGIRMNITMQLAVVGNRQFTAILSQKADHTIVGAIGRLPWIDIPARHAYGNTKIDVLRHKRKREEHADIGYHSIPHIEPSVPWRAS